MTKGRIKAGAVVLAAGLSSRFGGLPKALAEFQGQQLLKWATDGFRLNNVDQVVVVTGHGGAEVTMAAESLGLPTVYNSDYQKGMFSSIQAGVAALDGPEAFFILPVDGALVRPQTILASLTTWGRGGEGLSVLIPVFKGRSGHPPLIAGRHGRDILAWRGQAGLRGWLSSLMPPGAGELFGRGQLPESLTGPVTFFSRADEGIVCDLDTPVELAAAHSPEDQPRPSLNEAWRWLVQTGLWPEKLRHSIKVATGSWRLAQGLVASGFEIDPEAALLAGLLHDVAHGRARHALAGRQMAEAMGWPELALIMGAHTDLPREVLEAVDSGLAGGAGEGGGPYCSGPIDRPWALAALCVYLADKYWANDQPSDLVERFERSRRHLERGDRSPEQVRAGLDKWQSRKTLALAVEDWFRRVWHQEPMGVVRTGRGDVWEADLADLAAEV